jgi:hypothetical protein
LERLLLIDAVAAVVTLTLWYFLFSRYNRRKGEKALLSVKAACDGRAQVTEAHWLNTSRVQAKLRFAAHWVENARVTIRLVPRPLPVQWLLSLWRRERETITFEADLDFAPAFHLDVLRHCWLTDNKPSKISNLRDWTVVHPGPVVLTTRTQWAQELPPVVHTLMTSRGHSLVSVRFRPDSPHLAATVPLEALSDFDAACGFFNVVRDLAAGASTSRQ